jgi:hypothetical protein
MMMELAMSSRINSVMARQHRGEMVIFATVTSPTPPPQAPAD